MTTKRTGIMKFAIVAWKVSDNRPYTLKHKFATREEAEKEAKNAKKRGFRAASVIELKEGE